MKIQTYRRKESATRYASLLSKHYSTFKFIPVIYDSHRWCVQVTFTDGSRALVGLRANWKNLYHRRSTNVRHRP